MNVITQLDSLNTLFFCYIFFLFNFSLFLYFSFFHIRKCSRSEYIFEVVFILLLLFFELSLIEIVMY